MAGYDHDDTVTDNPCFLKFCMILNLLLRYLNYLFCKQIVITNKTPEATILTAVILSNTDLQGVIRPIGYERVYLPLCKVADTPFHIQGNELIKF